MTYVFLDLETTGFEADECDVLEIGIYACTDEFEPIAEFSIVRNYHIEDKPMHPDVVVMHDKNDLWVDCRRSTFTLEECENTAMTFMRSWGFKGNPLAGSTISFDRSFLHKHLPRLEEMFHYRNIDVSSFGEVFGKYEIQRPPKREAHRALADAKESADNLKYYLTMLGFFDE